MMLDTVDNPIRAKKPNPFEATNTERGINATFRFFKHEGEKDSEDIFLEWVKGSQKGLCVEYGTGRGNALAGLRSRLPDSFRIVGIDLFPSPVPETFIIGADFKHVPLPDGLVDRAFSIAALGCYAENVEDLEAQFRELYRVLAPNGKILFSPIPDNQDLKENISESNFAVQIPSKGGMGNLNENNYFLCPLLSIIEKIGFSYRITRKMEDRISGIELTKM